MKRVFENIHNSGSITLTAASSGGLSIPGYLGFAVGGGLTANGWVQASIGIAEIIGGLASEPKKAILKYPAP
ncbi:MAG: hypothetical protein LBD48_04675 [Treponema sp.]|jgi:hypothetical protein|nr:hypothetical protein [Treponema sp.]